MAEEQTPGDEFEIDISREEYPGGKAFVVSIRTEHLPKLVQSLANMYVQNAIQGLAVIGTWPPRAAPPFRKQRFDHGPWATWPHRIRGNGRDTAIRRNKTLCHRTGNDLIACSYSAETSASARSR